LRRHRAQPQQHWRIGETDQRLCPALVQRRIQEVQRRSGEAALRPKLPRGADGAATSVVFEFRQGSTFQSKRTIRGAASGRTGLQAAQGRRVGGGKNAGTREAREQQAWLLYPAGRPFYDV